MTKTRAKHTLRHEAIHAYDSVKLKVDYNDCTHIACAEVRAVNLSNECNYMREVQRGHFGYFKHYDECVKRTAKAILEGNAACRPHAQEYLEYAWKSCGKDYSPFPFIPQK